MRRTACTEPQCLYSTAIPLLPLWIVRPVQSLSACTVELYLYSPYGPYGLYRASVPVQYSYTSTPPMGRTACTEPQCLYNGALYLFYTGSRVKYPIFLSGLNETWILSRYLRKKTPKISNFMYVHPMEAELFHAEGNDKANSLFPQFF